MYSRELEALRRSKRFREPYMLDPSMSDMASNDYLGLAHKKILLKRACKKIATYPYHAPKSSLFVGGCHPVHKNFTEALCGANGFEAGVVAGSGFLANLGLIEALVRKNDTLFIDESYHASGMMACNLVKGRVVTFAHNDPEDLIEKICEDKTKGRRVVAVEGIYSMEGDILRREFFDIAEWFDALMIVDEAHSSGTVGPNLLGVFDHYDILPNDRHIKMGTLGKAYGSYGAYILGSKEVISFLQNRAKPLIYATAPSLFDIALAHEGFDYISSKRKKFLKKIKSLKKVVKTYIGTMPAGMIVPISVKDTETLLEIQAVLRKEGFEIGAIRPPTVKKPILRIILRTCVGPQRYRVLFENIKKALNG